MTPVERAAAQLDAAIVQLTTLESSPGIRRARCAPIVRQIERRVRLARELLHQARELADAEAWARFREEENAHGLPPDDWRAELAGYWPEEEPDERDDIPGACLCHDEPVCPVDR